MTGSYKIIATLWSELERKFAFYSVLIVVLGSLPQAYALVSMSPNMIVFFSIQQGIIDGAVSISFLFVNFIFLIVYAKSIVWIVQIPSQFWKIANVISVVGVSFILVLQLPENYFYLYTFIILAILVDYYPIVFDKFNKSKTINDIYNREPLFYLAIIYIVFNFTMYVERQNPDKIEFLENILNQNSNKIYEIKYYNADYLFLYNKQKDSYKVQKIDETIK